MNTKDLKEELEEHGEVTSPVYVYIYEDGSAEVDGYFEIEDLQVVIDLMQKNKDKHDT